MTSRLKAGLAKVLPQLNSHLAFTEVEPDLLPLMKRLENYQKPCNNDSHGYDGPIAISNGGQITPVAQDFLRAAHAIGIPYSGTSCLPSVESAISLLLCTDDIQGTTLNPRSHASY